MNIILSSLLFHIFLCQAYGSLNINPSQTTTSSVSSYGGVSRYNSRISNKQAVPKIPSEGKTGDHKNNHHRVEKYIYTVLDGQNGHAESRQSAFTDNSQIEVKKDGREWSFYPQAVYDKTSVDDTLGVNPMKDKTKQYDKESYYNTDKNYYNKQGIAGSSWSSVDPFVINSANQNTAEQLENQYQDNQILSSNQFGINNSGKVHGYYKKYIISSRPLPLQYKDSYLGYNKHDKLHYYGSSGTLDNLTDQLKLNPKNFLAYDVLGFLNKINTYLESKKQNASPGTVGETGLYLGSNPLNTVCDSTATLDNINTVYEPNKKHPLFYNAGALDEANKQLGLNYANEIDYEDEGDLDRTNIYSRTKILNQLNGNVGASDNTATYLGPDRSQKTNDYVYSGSQDKTNAYARPNRLIQFYRDVNAFDKNGVYMNKQNMLYKNHAGAQEETFTHSGLNNLNKLYSYNSQDKKHPYFGVNERNKFYNKYPGALYQNLYYYKDTHENLPPNRYYDDANTRVDTDYGGLETIICDVNGCYAYAPLGKIIHEVRKGSFKLPSNFDKQEYGFFGGDHTS